MRDKELYQQILGVHKPWRVADVELLLDQGEVVVHVEHSGEGLCCPECGAAASRHDHRERRWRHLDTCQFRTILAARVPRVDCPEHGVRQVAVPWAEPGSRFTAMFEALAIDWLREASQSAVARRLGLSWDETNRIMEAAVRRGLERRGEVAPRDLCVDETSFQKRHEYVSVVTQGETGHVLHVADGHGEKALNNYFNTLDANALAGIRSISMDMWKAYINSAKKYIPDAERKICFDRFHVSQHLNKAVDAVRRAEHKALQRDGRDDLKKTRYLWLENPERMDAERWSAFEALRESSLRTARAWSLKEHAATLWGYATRGWALRAWKSWLSWAWRCRLEPMLKSARTIRDHLWGILNAVALGVTNARAESINAKIQRLKRQACGYRNRSNFRTAILFHLGGLNLYPGPLTHTKA